MYETKICKSCLGKKKKKKIEKRALMYFNSQMHPSYHQNVLASFQQWHTVI